ncbi:putative secreted protein [Criblamydia sequanensis CRIB-18]|uniref:non-specific serine/threonine protein kinase n=2 Tax=Candidatus Criblamydia sequanensis TaxID=340071 RepID=A0A090D1K1_9BACT|nr:putative secreted protein [Criblamydia sequanensis CRIB-18]
MAEGENMKKFYAFLGFSIAWGSCSMAQNDPNSSLSYYSGLSIAPSHYGTWKPPGLNSLGLNLDSPHFSSVSIAAYKESPQEAGIFHDDEVVNEFFLENQINEEKRLLVWLENKIAANPFHDFEYVESEIIEDLNENELAYLSKAFVGSTLKTSEDQIVAYSLPKKEDPSLNQFANEPDLYREMTGTDEGGSSFHEYPEFEKEDESHLYKEEEKLKEEEKQLFEVNEEDIYREPKPKEFSPEASFYDSQRSDMVLLDENQMASNENLKAPFYIGKREVTNREYLAYVQANNAKAPSHWVRGIPRPGTENQPVVNVSHQEAEKFAKWKGMRLPTLSEWLLANELEMILEEKGLSEWFALDGENQESPKFKSNPTTSFRVAYYKKPLKEMVSSPKR